MLTQKIYYQLKPLIPRSVQFFIRRIIARGKLISNKHIWPIDESSAIPPEGWNGWPEEKKFAFVLTHDVETYGGLQKCKRLAEIEMELGFRSSFNFVAEDYPLDKDILKYLSENGFEIGIHGLTHKGNMFSPPRRFFNEAPRINHYLREWKAVGFRAPSMYRDFNLLRFLDILYDSSGFDTDPFEPQPEGLRTIFPLFIPNQLSNQPNMLNWLNRLNVPNRPNRLNRLDPSNPSNSSNSSNPSNSNNQKDQTNPSLCSSPQRGEGEGEGANPSNSSNSIGFIELPYTLPQDHTLFLILKEKDWRIWKEKLDWIAGKGGMALILTHTDYMSFNGKRSNLTYPAEYYIKFLEYVKSTYSGICWHTLPREVAHFILNSLKPR